MRHRTKVAIYTLTIINNLTTIRIITKGKIMKKVYTHENQFIVNNMKNIIEAENIDTFLKNEFTQGAIGEIPSFETWPEIWVVEDSDAKKALAIINKIQHASRREDWMCNHCGESNDASFEVCWQCQKENTEG